MLNKIKNILLPHFIGLSLILFGYYFALINVGLDRFSANTIITNGTSFGLALILLGAYFPELWGLVFVKKSES